MMRAQKILFYLFFFTNVKRKKKHFGLFDRIVLGLKGLDSIKLNSRVKPLGDLGSKTT